MSNTESTTVVVENEVEEENGAAITPPAVTPEPTAAPAAEAAPVKKVPPYIAVQVSPKQREVILAFCGDKAASGVLLGLLADVIPGLVIEAKVAKARKAKREWAPGTTDEQKKATLAIETKAKRLTMEAFLAQHHEEYLELLAKKQVEAEAEAAAEAAKKAAA